jgi:transposase
MARGKKVAGRLNAWICFADEAGQTLHPAKATSWAPRGHTPVVQNTAKGNVRVSIAALTCYRPGERSRLIYRTLTYHRGAKTSSRGFRERELIALLDAAHQQLRGPIVLIWDRLPAHRSARMRKLIAARAWLRVYLLPGYAPELNPVEKVWSNLKRSLANLAATTATALTTAVKNRLNRMQHHTTLTDSYLTATGLRPP